MSRWPSARERYDAQVFPEPMSGCWLWTGHARSDGYGTTCVNGKRMKAHRYSYEIHRGPIPDGMFVCHRCDNPYCVNPDHLYLGTHQENMRDMAAKGRADRLSKPFGEQVHTALLTTAQAAEIRAITPSTEAMSRCAAKYGVKPETVRSIWAGRSWNRALGIKRGEVSPGYHEWGMAVRKQGRATRRDLSGLTESAPALLRALRVALYAITEIDNSHKSLRQIREAIAKAEGRSTGYLDADSEISRGVDARNFAKRRAA